MKFIKEKALAYFSETDKLLWALCPVLSIISLFLIYGTLESGYADLLQITRRNLFVQGGAVVSGILAAFVLSNISYRLLRKAWVVHVPLCYLLVFLTFFIGVGAAARPDDKRWLIIPGIDVWLQPSELLKISFILVFAYHLTACKENLNKPLNILLLGAHAAVPVALIHFQGDDGTALLIAVIAVAMLFMAGINWRYIAAGLVGAALLVPIVWNFILDEFQKNRILAILNKDQIDALGQDFQQYQSILAIAMGGRTGIGLVGVRHVYVPEMHTDFIFSFLCESFGLMGAMGVLVLMVVLCLKILYNSFRADDAYGSLICVGVFAMLLFQFLVNVGMCLFILPVIGNTFPFLSYGGSSVLTSYLGIGLVLSVYQHNRRSMFD